MVRANWTGWGLFAGAVVALGMAACAADSGGFFSDNASGKDNADAGAADGRNAPAAGTAGFATQGGPTATGVILVHAASFPAFRLCFDNQLDLQPQPDSKVMPEANVVGVELGSVVRIDPLDPPGKIYVIDESKVRSSANDPTIPTCGELLAKPAKTTRSLTYDNDYHVIQVPVNQPLGKTSVDALVISGCGSQAFLNDLDGLSGVAKASSANCGADWDSTDGNLKATVINLPTSPAQATASSIPVQIFHMSRPIEALRGDAGTLGVQFGTLDGGGAKAVPVGGLFAPGAQTSLAVDQSDQAVYGKDGFVVSIVGASRFETAQSLAAIQALSSPTDVPTTYYLAASNYALLLLGDPAHQPFYTDGGANPIYNPRRAVHLLAVPVIDPNSVDAGSDAATPNAPLDAGH
jgi:hypothetical protein